MTREKVRLSVDLAPEVNDLLETLASQMHGTKSDVLRKGIALMQVALDAKKHGQKFGVAKQDQKLDKEIVGL